MLTKLPTRNEAIEAKDAARALAPVLRRRGKGAVKVRATGDGPSASVSVPREAFQFFLEILGHMANGSTVTILPIHAELTSQEAADLLRVSRPYLVQLLESGAIPHRMVGSHRRILASDLLAYLEKDKASRRAILDELASEAQKHKLGY